MVDIIRFCNVSHIDAIVVLLRIYCDSLFSSKEIGKDVGERTLLLAVVVELLVGVELESIDDSEVVVVVVVVESVASYQRRENVEKKAMMSKNLMMRMNKTSSNRRKA